MTKRTMTTNDATDQAKGFLVSDSPGPPASPLTAPSLSLTDTRRVARPHYLSDIENAADLRAEFEAGAQALGLIGNGKSLTPQQYELADLCNSRTPEGLPLYELIGILLPRRSGKTTSLVALALGRCLSRENYLVGFTFATTAGKVQQRFKADVFPVLERVWPDPEKRPFKIVRSNGHEQIVFDHGSRIVIHVPSGEAYRSEAFDLIIVDESGEATPAEGEDILAGALPTMDTREGAQLIVSGTAAKYRRGNLLWDQLQEGRDGIAGSGILEYSAPDYLSVEELEDWDALAPVLEECHPGIGTLTTLAKIERNWRKYRTMRDGLNIFQAEYLGVFGDAGGSKGMVDPALWNALELPGDFPEPPTRFALAVSSDGQRGSIVAAWRVDGRAHLLELAAKDGVAWLAPEALRLSREHRVPIHYDNFGAVLEQIELLQESRPRPQLRPATPRDVYIGAARFLKEVQTSNLSHWGQERLNGAVLRTTRRNIRNDKAWSFGHAEKGDDITGVEAAAVALHAFDKTPAKRVMPRVTVAA